ncbi:MULTISPECIES: arginine repressor [Lacticaseibacillus]|uniref:Arginine repressor n=2 Tax=Lacticaseibacillus TaxID=2759736 RepID=A0A4Q1UF97_9LACO|nr:MULTISPECIES: ArgR family transcriptional regulator [Lacticaseibacillus]HAJ53566.1 ArgR family transcriptional regulator [Lactobacillus sp.]MBI6596688.1 ArgR family transcriptional regulator [Lacticaseibacillus casei]MBO1480333.1 ArgR family transcriptional regulator [Lacticaseibacillus casei]MBO2415658.1 ArgR family transcriptional regulator [Lacticaseibacillus casei]MCK2080017.1 ArgR family transcriptional regulator [Lacticaseibacillus casei]
MRKRERQAIIQRLIRDEPIERQEDLVARLNDLNIPVTQATISRDIKEMQLIKVPAGEGHYRYSMPVEKQLPATDKLKRTLVTAMKWGEAMDNFVHLALLPGTAAAVETLIEQLDDQRIFATISGDASILIICRSAQYASAVLSELEAMVG